MTTFEEAEVGEEEEAEVEVTEGGDREISTEEVAVGILSKHSCLVLPREPMTRQATTRRCIQAYLYASLPLSRVSTTALKPKKPILRPLLPMIHMRTTSPDESQWEEYPTALRHMCPPKILTQPKPDAMVAAAAAGGEVPAELLPLSRLTTHSSPSGRVREGLSLNAQA